MRLRQSGGFRQYQIDDAEIFDIMAAPPSWSYFAASVLLGILFGIPTILVLLNPARRDSWSIAAAACGVLVLGLSLRAAWRAVSGRGLQRLRLTTAGVTVGHPGTTISWSQVSQFEVLGGSLPPPPAKLRPPHGSTHNIGAAIAAQQQASNWCLALQQTQGGRPIFLATGLDAATAHPLCAAVTATARRFTPSATLASSRDAGC